MNKRLLDLVACPECKGRLAVEAFERELRPVASAIPGTPRCQTYCAREGIARPREAAATIDCKACYEEEIVSGILRCGCDKAYPVIRGVPRLYPSGLRHFWHELSPWRDKLAGLFPGNAGSSPLRGLEKEVEQVKQRFEFQWEKWACGRKIFGRNREEMLAQIRRDLEGSLIDSGYFPGKLVLDAGCGHGRYMDCFHEMGAEVVGVDLGEGVDIAHERLSHLRFAHFIQADILQPAFREGIFDFVFSYGVVHHTPSSRRAFDALSRLVVSGGWMEVWVYPREGRWWELSQKLIRSVTTRLPPRFVYLLCYIPVPLLGLKSYSGTSLANSSWRECAQVIWDWYSPRYQFHHTREEVRTWFEKAGFEALKFFAPDVGMIGRRKWSPPGIPRLRS